jgi:hypothetical protein
MAFWESNEVLLYKELEQVSEWSSATEFPEILLHPSITLLNEGH